MVAAFLVIASPLLAGVTEIASPGVPGPLVVFGDRAEVVVAAKQGKYLEPVVASAYFGEGRVVAFGHGGYFGEGSMTVGQTRQLLVNAVRWAKKREGVVGIHRATDMEQITKSEGLVSKRLSELDLENLSGISLLVIDPNGETAKYAPTIRKYVEDGGGLIIAGLGWGWLQLNPNKTIHQHPCNLIVQPMGIAWADGYLERNSQAGILASAGSKAVHAGLAFDFINEPPLAPQAGHSITRAITTLGRDHVFVKNLSTKLTKLSQQQPTEPVPLRVDDVGSRIALALSLDGDGSKAHPAARHFPGMPTSEAKPVTKGFNVDLSRPRWHSTGLYALPGQPLRVVTTEAAQRHGLRVRIGAHSDSLWHHDEWKRAPEVSLSVPVASTDFTVSSAFGGLVYIEVPKAAPEQVTVRIGNAIEAPRYVLGQTTDEDWATIRSSPAPWAELESSKIILTVPSEHVRKLDNPRRLMEFWDKVADACADFAAIPRERNSAERFVADVQISAGYMHAGYPIMTHLDAAPRMVDLGYLTNTEKGGDWGMFHEIGHNHQESDWTFEGTGEVTNNLFTLYIIDTVVGKRPSYRVRWTDEEILVNFRKHRTAGAPFEKWKSDPFLALTMYVQLQKAFGWEPFKKVFAEYRALPQNERPRNDAEKRDQWMVRFSRAVGRNLGPFFVAWGVPVSLKARDSIHDLPVWEFPR